MIGQRLSHGCDTPQLKVDAIFCALILAIHQTIAPQPASRGCRRRELAVRGRSRELALKPLPKTGIGSQGLPKTGIGSQGLPKGGMVTNPQSLPKGTTTKTGPDSVNVNRNVNLGNTKNTG